MIMFHRIFPKKDRAVFQLRTSGYTMSRITRVALVLLVAAGIYAIAEPNTPVSESLAKAQKAFKAQNWADARTEFDHARDLAGDWHSPEARLAIEGAVACSMRLNQWDDALTRSQAFVDQNKGRFEEAVGERFLAGIYLSVPHQGTKQGGTYHRGEWGQGVQVSSFKKDRKEAVKRYEHARDILAGLVKNIGATPDNADTPDRHKLLNGEQIGLNFDLVAALASHEDFYGGWGWCFWWWGSGEPEEESDAVDEADYEQPRGYGRYPSQQEKPNGLPLGPDGQPRFMAIPTAYAANLGDGPKIRFLLEEVQHLDTSETRDDTARALFRLAMICRSLYGPDIMQQWNNQGTRYDRFGHPLPKPADADAPAKKLWELGDDEAIAIAGGKLQVVTLPAQESPLALLKRIEAECPKSSLVPEAIYSRALFFQSRKQFPQAMADYQRLMATFPKADRSKSAQAQINLIRQPGVMLEQTGVHLPDEKPVLGFTCRNTDEVRFTARRFNLLGYINQGLAHLDNDNYWRINNLASEMFQHEDWQKFTGETVAKWTETGLHNEANRTEEGKTSAPLTEPGAYLVDAHVGGNPDGTRLLVFISDIAIVHKNLPSKGLIYVAYARTGQALAKHPVRIIETWTQYDAPKGVNRFHVIDTPMTTNADGAIEYRRKQNQYGSNIDAIVTDGNNRMAFSFFQNWNENDYNLSYENGPRYYVITDRPVYRPGSTVKFRAWIRNRENGQYQNAQAGQAVTVDVWDPKNSRLMSLSPTTDESGSVSGEYALDEKAPLGVYTIRINGAVPNEGYPYGNRFAAGGLFRVEEYKKPEFEVTVTPAKTQARLGEKVSAHIAARYYFGAPVEQGQISYKIFREDYHHVYWGPGEYDWLYGAGYGRDYYPYPWFPWWGRWGCFIIGDLWPWSYGYPYGGYLNDYGGDQETMDRRSAESGTRHALRELIAQGEGQLKPDGGYDVEFDTAPALRELGDRDHRYTIEAEVRDASRRTITGQGDIKVTRQQFYAFAETREGWYQPQEDVFVDVRTLSADNAPVATQGKVTVYKVSYDGSGQSIEKEEAVKSWDASTDADGRLSFKYPVPSEGQYRVSYVTHDDWQQEVQANAVFWVAGPAFDGRIYRFNDLEIIADKRTYKPGETAHLLVNTAENNSRILFSDTVIGEILRTYRFIDLPQRSTIIDVPITDAQMPNFFVEATLVRNGRVHMESRELFVPPSRNLLNLAVETDKETYKPGEQGKVRVKLTDADGKPVAGHVTLTAFDQAVTYIQDEFGPAPKVFFYGQRREHQPFVDASLDHIYNPFGTINAPDTDLYTGGVPDGWNGAWPISGVGLTLSGSTNGIAKDEDGYIVGGMSRRDIGSDSIDSLSTADLQGQVHSVFATVSAPISNAAGGAMAMEKSADAPAPAPTSPGGEMPDSPKLVDPTIRNNFADTALWLPDLKTDDTGQAETTITFPDSLTTWRVHAYGLTTTTQVGDGITHTTTSKNLIVRLEAPRFFIERDEAVLSANVHNYLAGSKSVTTELILPAAQFQSLEQPDLQPDKDGFLHLTATASVNPKGEHRFDWPVKVLKEGTAHVTVKALTDEESDAMQLAFPVLVHGINKMVAQGGSYRVGDNGSRDLKLELPAEIDPEQTKLEVTLSPSLAGVMIDALPYLAGYPYGCVEQTMSRFYPSVLVKDTLKKMGTDLESVAKQRKQMYTTQDLQHRFRSPDLDPVFNSEELDRMVSAGLRRIVNFQHSDGGWGWWAEDDSSPFETAYVLQGLEAARQAGIAIDMDSYENGLNFLQNSIRRELAKPKEKQELGGVTEQAYVAYILALAGRPNNDDQTKWLDDLYEHRGDQNNYGKALLALTFKLRKQDDRASLLLQNILQFAARDDSNETAWIRTPQEGWWFWWNNDIETNAWVLKALVAIDPKNDLSPRIVKWLLNNRKNGTYWRSTRDTAQVIAAMADYMKASGEGNPDYNLVVKLDGAPVKTVKVTKENFFTFDNRFLLYGLEVEPGPHTITLEKDGPGALYYSAYLSYFTKEEDIKGAGNEILITREYYRLKPKTETVKAETSGAGWWGFGTATPNPAGQDKPDDAHTELRAGFDRIPLHNGDAVTSGDQVEVVLKIHAKNTYDYLAFEDMKPAGCEAVDLRSGGKFAGGLCPNVELRDEKVVFFIGLLEQGDHILRYKLRAETPGTFHALPTSGYAMYAPEVRAISDEMKLKIDDQR
jgi:alpha-2-macroglobulin